MHKQTMVYGPRALSRFDILGIRTIEGEEGAQTPPTTPPAEPAAPAPQAPPAAPAAPPAEPKPPINYRGDRDDYVRELRDEAKTHRLAAEKAAADYATALAEREALTAERDGLARERALLLNAPKNGARADLLLDSTSFMKTFAAVDLTDEAAVTKAITDAVEKNSAYRAISLPSTSGGGHQGGGAPKQNITLDGAVKAALSS